MLISIGQSTQDQSGFKDFVEHAMPSQQLTLCQLI